MPNPEIEEFAKILVQKVRDAAIRNSDTRLRAGAGHPIGKRWKEEARDGNIDSFANALIPDIVDDTIFYLLHAIDQELLQLAFNASNRKVVNLPKDGLGELGGWYMGSSGWRAMYSNERFVDDFSDLKNDGEQ